jgi:hypothetical protein
MFTQYGGRLGYLLKFNNKKITDNIYHMYYISEKHKNKKNFAYKNTSGIMYIVIYKDELEHDMNKLEFTDEGNNIYNIEIKESKKTNESVNDNNDELIVHIKKNDNDIIYEINNKNIKSGTLNKINIEDGSKISKNKFVEIIKGIQKMFNISDSYYITQSYNVYNNRLPPFIVNPRPLMRVAVPIKQEITSNMFGDVGDMSRWSCKGNMLLFRSTNGQKIKLGSINGINRISDLEKIFKKISEYVYSKGIFVWKGTFS